MLKLYGVKTCDTCRKARRWLDSNRIEYQYIDLREDGINRARLQEWLGTHGGKRLINKRSRTWRELDDNAREHCAQAPLEYLIEHPTLIKRPVLETGNTTLVGFSTASYETALGGNQ